MFLDEVDKIGSVPGIHQLRDVGGEGVQQVSIQPVLLHIKLPCGLFSDFKAEVQDFYLQYIHSSPCQTS